MLQARPERRNVLQADVQVWRTGSVRSRPAEGPRGWERPAQRLLADTMLDNVVPKDLPGKNW